MASCRALSPLPASSALSRLPVQAFCLPMLANQRKPNCNLDLFRPLDLRFSQSIGRRVALSWLLIAGSSAQTALAGKEELLLVPYIDEKEGFTLQRPEQWIKVQKSGATALFEDPTFKSNNVGVVVNPVRISSLREFGSPQVVAEKLIEAEKRKPSTNDVQLIQVKERELDGHIPLYELEYKLDSTSGVKHIFSAVTVASKKLYILNISYEDSSQKPLLHSTASVLQQMLDSFNVLQ